MRSRPALKYIIGGLVGATIPTLLIAGQGFAEEKEPIQLLTESTNLLWVVIGAILVVFMQAGFALVETGFTQKKNAAEVMSMNFAIFGLASSPSCSSVSRWRSEASAIPATSASTRR